MVVVLIAGTIIAIVFGGIYLPGFFDQQQKLRNTDYKKILQSPEGKVCIQVITPAKNLKTGECNDFPTPCDVPAEWEKVESC